MVSPRPVYKATSMEGSRNRFVSIKKKIQFSSHGLPTACITTYWPFHIARQTQSHPQASTMKAENVGVRGWGCEGLGMWEAGVWGAGDVRS